MQIQHANTALGLQQQRVTRLEEQLHVTNQQLQKVADDARHYQMQAEGHRRQAQGIDAALQETRSTLEQAEKVRGVGLERGVDRTSERFGRFWQVYLERLAQFWALGWSWMEDGTWGAEYSEPREPFSEVRGKAWAGADGTGTHLICISDPASTVDFVSSYWKRSWGFIGSAQVLCAVAFL
jgi:hypothetical protein